MPTHSSSRTDSVTTTGITHEASASGGCAARLVAGELVLVVAADVGEADDTVPAGGSVSCGSAVSAESGADDCARVVGVGEEGDDGDVTGLEVVVIGTGAEGAVV